MPLFTLYCIDKPGHQQVRLDNRAAHLDYAKQWADKTLTGGPLLSADGDSMVGSLLVIDFEDAAAAEAFCANDPYAKAGLFESVTVRPFKAVLGTVPTPA